MTVSVLFARSDSVYKSMGCDVWDIDRDARNFAGDNRIVAHPPCRGWGRLREFAKPVPGEKELAFFAVDRIRENGGVLEHPTASSLWGVYGLPRPGQGFDSFGGFSIQVKQFWWGHKAEKSTWLYICGIDPDKVPVIPLVLGEPSHVVSQSKSKHKPRLPEISKADRERTPPEFASWLVDLASKCEINA